MHFVLDQHADFYSVSSLKQQSAGRHVTPLWHIILISSQPVFALPPWCCMLNGEAITTNFIVFGLTRPGLELTALEASTLTITPPVLFQIFGIDWYRYYCRTSLARTWRDCQNLFELSEVWGPVILERTKSCSDPGQFHYAMITDAQ